VNDKPSPVPASSGFLGAFGPSDRLWVPASETLRACVAAMRRQAPSAPRTPQGIPAARAAFAGLVERSLRAQGLQGQEPSDDGIRTGTVDVDGVPLVYAEPATAPRGAVLHIHGGGWCVGSAKDLLPALAALAQRTSTCVASVEYRLAPEHPHPAALEDCERAVRGWLHALRRRHGIRPEQVVIAGESAGAHLALLTVLRPREQGIRLAGAILTYGLFDLGNTLPSRDVADTGNLVIDAQACRFYVRMLLGDDAVVDDPAVSPLQLPASALAGLPPALFSVGTLDPLHDDSVQMHARWRSAGNPGWLAVYEQAPHAFDLLPVPERKHHQRLQDDFIRHCLSRLAQEGSS
jgi:acetyl esterase/lipase